MSRRRFFKTLAGLGVSVGAIQGLTQETFAQLVDDPHKEVPRVHSYIHTNHEAVVKKGASPEREPVYYKIPRHRWARVEGAYDAREQIEEMLAGRPEETSVWVTTNRSGEKLIRVRVHDDGSLGTNAVRNVERVLPDTIDGVAGRGTNAEKVIEDINVTVARINPRELITDLVSTDSTPDHYWEDWSDNIPGGAGARFKIGDNWEPATVCTPAYGGDVVGDIMITAGHALDHPDAPETDSIDAQKPADNDDNHFVASPTFHEVDLDSYFDAGVMLRDTGIDVQYGFATDWGGTTGDIVGSVSESRLKDIEDHGTNTYETLKQQGSRTGNNTGFGIRANTRKGFRTTLSNDDVDKGDSGGPYHIETAGPFTQSDSHELVFGGDFIPDWESFNTIAGVHFAAQENLGTFGTAMHSIEDEWPVEV
jgi:hypothetical protein